MTLCEAYWSTASTDSKICCFHGNHAAIHQYSEEYLTEIQESSVSTWKLNYVAELDCK